MKIGNVNLVCAGVALGGAFFAWMLGIHIDVFEFALIAVLALASAKQNCDSK